MAELMTDAGYNSYMTGKWHLGPDVENGPHARGFRHSFVSLDGAAHLGGWDWRGPQPANYRDDDEIVHVGDDFYTTRFYTERMLQYIDHDRAEGKPFFAYLAYTAPHWPLQAPTESIARFKGKYDAGYEALYASRFARQKQLGLVAKDAQPIDNARFKPRWSELSSRREEARSRAAWKSMRPWSATSTPTWARYIAHLKETGDYDNTFIMFISDNGAESGRRDLQAPIKDHVGKEYDNSLDNIGHRTSYVMYGPNWASASETPWNRHKATAFEGGIHVPAFVNYPQLVKAGTRSDAIGTVRDILPTFLELAGAQLSWRDVQGQGGAAGAGSHVAAHAQRQVGRRCIRRIRYTHGNCLAPAPCIRATGNWYGTRRRPQRNVAGNCSMSQKIPSSSMT